MLVGTLTVYEVYCACLNNWLKKSTLNHFKKGNDRKRNKMYIMLHSL